MADLYIYYRVRDEHAAELAPRVRAMQLSLGKGAVRRRPGSSEGRQTWMEIYTDTAPAFAATLEAAIASAELMNYIDGPRHTEIFTDLESCV